MHSPPGTSAARPPWFRSSTSPLPGPSATPRVPRRSPPGGAPPGRRPATHPPARLPVAPPSPEALAAGRVYIQYRAENLRIVQVFGRGALDVSPRIGHIHVTVDDLPWHWADASGEQLILTGLERGNHKVLIELVDANHRTIDEADR